MTRPDQRARLILRLAGNPVASVLSKPRHPEGSYVMKKWISVLLLSMGMVQVAAAACPPEGRTRQELIALQATGFAWAKDAEPDLDTFAPRMVDCLGSSDPELREEIAYEALATWLRSGKLKKPALLAIEARLVEMLGAKEKDRDGFARSFAALTLAEVVKADRRKAFLKDEQVGELLLQASDYLENLNDYRGFDAKTGWRHGIAHGADLLNQLVMHPRIKVAGIERILSAVSNQVAPENGHFYIYGESERLALPIMYAAQRGGIGADDWREWFAEIAGIPEDGSLFDSQAGLARRHNMQALLLVLYVNVNESGDNALRESLLAPVTEMLKALQ